MDSEAGRKKHTVLQPFLSQGEFHMVKRLSLFLGFQREVRQDHESNLRASSFLLSLSTKSLSLKFKRRRISVRGGAPGPRVAGIL